MGSPEQNIAGVYDYENDKKLITSDFRSGTNLEKELQISEQCDGKMDSLEKVCDQRVKELDATITLLKLQEKISNKGNLNDIDLVYDPKIDKFRFRLFDQDNLVIPIDLDNSATNKQDLGLSKLEKFGEIIVNIVNNIHQLAFENDNLASHKNYQEISSKNVILPNSHLLSSESLKEIFYFNPNDNYPDTQANAMFDKIKAIIIEAQKYNEYMKNKGIEIE